MNTDRGSDCPQSHESWSYPLRAGLVEIRLPDNIDPEEVDEVGDFLALLLRRIQRRFQAQPLPRD